MNEACEQECPDKPYRNHVARVTEKHTRALAAMEERASKYRILRLINGDALNIRYMRRLLQETLQLEPSVEHVATCTGFFTRTNQETGEVERICGSRVLSIMPAGHGTDNAQPRCPGIQLNDDTTAQDQPPIIENS